MSELTFLQDEAPVPGSRSAQAIDVHVGGRVKLRRVLLGMSQEMLGEKLGLTFQQVQKYEKAANRISASRLYQISEALGVPVQFFFDDLPGKTSNGANIATLVEPALQRTILEFLQSRQAMELHKAFASISDPDIRSTLVTHTRALAQCSSV
jgi:transcriptional regulator with XRE-family HTH domain